MEIYITKGSLEYLADCVEALSESELGRRYFSKEGGASKAVKEGMEQGTLYVAIADGVCAGFVWYIPNGIFHSFPYLHIIAVKEAYRSRGIGRQLVEFAEKAAGKDKIFLVAADFNPRAKAFYEKMGYRQVGEIPSLYRKGVNERLMMKDLAPIDTMEA